MKLGVLTVLFGNDPLEETLQYLSSKGVTMVELGAGGFTNPSHLQPEKLIDNPQEQQKLKDLLQKYNMGISALSCHGNPVHPNQEIAKEHDEIYRRTVRLAEQLGVDTIVTFSGCPGDSDTSQYPNWVTCPWPDDYQKILKWQWEEKLIPYWKEAVKFANDHGIKKIALEMHPGFCVYNPKTCLKLREAVGDTIGANFDPSHLFWQGMDAVAAINELGKAIYFVHAKDTKINRFNTEKNGVLDTGHFSNEPARSWLFRSVGYGHSEEVWRDIVSALRMNGYDGVMSIEHEDSLMTSKEGLEKAIDLLKRVMIFEEKPGGMWWA